MENNQNTIKPEMTLDMKAKFFAQYLFQKIILASDYDPNLYDLVPYSLSLIRKGNNSTRLLLTPLSDITDEDAIEVVKISIGFEMSNILFRDRTGTSIASPKKWRQLYQSTGSSIDDVSIVANFSDDSVSVINGSIRMGEHVKISDYLRSRGYALPWMGYSVEEMVNAGWVKLKGGK